MPMPSLEGAGGVQHAPPSASGAPPADTEQGGAQAGSEHAADGALPTSASSGEGELAGMEELRQLLVSRQPSADDSGAAAAAAGDGHGDGATANPQPELSDATGTGGTPPPRPPLTAALPSGKAAAEAAACAPEATATAAAPFAGVAAAAPLPPKALAASAPPFGSPGSSGVTGVGTTDEPPLGLDVA